jgi:hypothetical protein
MDDETRTAKRRATAEPQGAAEPRCTVCNEPVADDGQRGWIRAPGGGERLENVAVLYHHRACEREGRSFLATP